LIDGFHYLVGRCHFTDAMPITHREMAENAPQLGINAARQYDE
jgi:hypothetical protein